ncbi:MAG TPA: enolase C-terminal domain-like protein, partial [bacterium]|nr:enolase C-terminal domain-like protein [bacterium]
KLQKAGGIYPSMQIAKYCKEHGMKIMVGAMIEDTIGLTACVHFATANSNVVLTDLDTDLDTPKYINGGSYLGSGKRKIYSRHGLGIDFDVKRLSKYKNDVVYRKLI